MKTIYDKLYSQRIEVVDKYKGGYLCDMKSSVSMSLRRNGLPSAIFPTTSRLFFMSYLYRVDVEYQSILRSRAKR